MTWVAGRHRTRLRQSGRTLGKLFLSLRPSLGRRTKEGRQGSPLADVRWGRDASGDGGRVRTPPTKGGRRKSDVRTFGTTAAELLQLADWLTEHGVTHVAMESTGVLW